MIVDAEPIGRMGVYARRFPWSALLNLRLRASLAWVLLEEPCLQEEVSRAVEDHVEVIVGRAEEMDHLMRKDPVSILVVEDHDASRVVKSTVGNSRCLRCVLSFRVSRRSRKWMPGWDSFGMRVRHADVGGVTDGSWETRVWIKRSSGSKKAEPSVSSPPVPARRPSQDLRSILKFGIEGRRCEPPDGVTPLGVNRVEWGPGGRRTVWSWGLWPVWSRASLVPVQHFGSSWIERPFSVSERLLAMDVPESLFLGASDESRSLILSSIKVPQKIRQSLFESISEWVWRSARPVLGKRKIRSEPQEPVPSFHQRKTPRLTLPVVDSSMREAASTKEAPDGGDGTTRERIASCECEGYQAECQRSDGDLMSYPELDRNAKAVKHDKAPVPVWLWDDKLAEGLSAKVQERNHAGARYALRGWLLSRWKRRVLKSYFAWRKSVSPMGEADRKRNDEAARDVIRRTSNASWWGWDAGSRPIFWRWPSAYVATIRDGLSLWLQSPLEPWTKRQRLPANRDTLTKVVEKLKTVRERGYVEPGEVVSLISFFDVPKGEQDIRMVYDGTKSGLNEALWAPWFPLPTVQSMLRALEPGTFQADNDVGEMFLNFMLDEKVRRLCGIDLTKFFPGETSSTAEALWERWCRCAMGLRPSPYQAVQGMLWAEVSILGNRLDLGNVFRWSRVRLNLPGSETYDPRKPWVSKVRKDDTLAADYFTFVDDQRTTAPSDRDAWHASQRVSSVLGWLGIQDAPRKRRGGSLEPGAWSGSVTHTSSGCVTVLASQEKWDKTKRILDDIAVEVAQNGDAIPFKKLESHRGFLIYMGQTYPSIVPYLRGIHGTLDSWRSGRDAEGWKVSPVDADASDLIARLRHWEEVESPSEGGTWTGWGAEPPKTVAAVPRLADDVRVLQQFFSDGIPVKRMVRTTRKVDVVYGFGDASGLGFGVTLYSRGSLHWSHGKWTLEQESSSNYRELRNLVEGLERAYDDGFLTGCEVFLFTDNSTAESAFWRGTSSSRPLFELVVRLRRLEMRGDFVLRLVHVSGTRMIAQGTDGLSRGDHGAGVMAGKPFSTYIPLHLSASDRSPELDTWVRSWTGEDLVVLRSEHWFEPLPARGNYLWVPAPGAASVAVERMARSIHRDASSLHVFVVPRLMTAWWRKTLQKAADLVFSIPCTGSPLWSLEQHEPLIVGICFPLISHRPWRLRSTRLMDDAERKLREMSKNHLVVPRNFLRKLLGQARGLDAMPEGVVWQLLRRGNMS